MSGSIIQPRSEQMRAGRAPEQESLDELLAAWRAETPVPDEVQQQVEAELDDVGLTAPTRRSSRMAG